MTLKQATLRKAQRQATALIKTLREIGDSLDDRDDAWFRDVNKLLVVVLQVMEAEQDMTFTIRQGEGLFQLLERYQSGDH